MSSLRVTGSDRNYLEFSRGCQLPSWNSSELYGACGIILGFMGCKAIPEKDRETERERERERETEREGERERESQRRKDVETERRRWRLPCQLRR